MPNTLGTLSGTIVLQTALELAFKKFPLLNALALDLSPAIVKFGVAVYSRILAVPPVQNFGAAPDVLTMTDVPVTIDQFKQVLFSLTPQELAGTSRDLVMEQAEPIAVAIAGHMTAAMAALWTIANYPNNPVTAAVVDSDYGTIVAARKSLNLSGAPSTGRYLVVNAAVYEKLLLDPTVVSSFRQAPQGEPIVDGVIRGVAGFEGIYEYPDLPTTGNMTGFAGCRSSGVYAGRTPEADPALFPGSLRTVSEPSSGLSVLFSEWMDTALVRYCRAAWMYGVAKGDAKQGVILKSA